MTNHEMAEAQSSPGPRARTDFYGDETTARAPQDLYAERDAALALEDAEFVAHWCDRLIGH